MHGHEPLAFLDEGQKIFPLSGSDLRMICVEKQSIELIEALGIVQSLTYARDIIEINRIPAQSLRKDREIFIRIMMLGLVPEKKHADRIGRSVLEKKGQQKQKERETSHVHKRDRVSEKGCGKIR